MSFCTELSLNFLPINLLIAKSVFSGLVTACLLAGIPTNVSSPKKKKQQMV